MLTRGILALQWETASWKAFSNFPLQNEIWGVLGEL